ncbi:MAG: prolyl oligopeptidase family serine peptidase, partial [Verrucomicrobiales bacterium]|nr:prolyl oligopeptidase family serine peptidase [Verrucomicrobiales bacterium]
KKHAEKFQLDMDRVVTFGGSAGGHLAMMVALSGPKEFEGDPLLRDYIVNPAGCITLFGPSSFMDPSLFLSGVDGARQLDGSRFAERMIKGAEASTYEKAEAPLRGMMKKMSPITYLEKDSPPILSIHGDRDVLIPKHHSAYLKESADKIGARVEVVIVKGAGHGFSGEKISPTQSEIYEIMGRFAQQF